MPRAVTAINTGGNTYNINDMNTADEFSTSTTYAKGDYCYRAGYLYRFTANHSAGAWNANHVTQVKLAEDVTDLKGYVDTSVSALEDAISDAERSVINMVRPSNLFDVSASTFGKRLTADGETDVPQFLISDYIDVLSYANNTIYFYESVPYVEVYNVSKVKLGGKNNATSIDLSGYTGARYIRISLGATAAYTMIVSNRATMTHQDYGLSFTRPSENLDIRKQIADWDYRNNVTAENILMDIDTLTFASCCGYKSYKWITDGQYSIALASQAGETVDLRWTTSSAKNFIGVQVIRLKIFCEHAANISNVTFVISGDTTYSRTVTRTFTYGWNDIPLITAQNNTLSAENWSTASSFRIYFTGTGEFTAYVGAVNLERMDKAKCIFVDDHSYHGFKERAYPLLKAVGQPVTWAINPGRLGTMVGTTEQILTQEDIDELAFDFYSEFSMHNWNPTGNPTADMTPDELRQDYHKCITYLKQHGICPKHLWRAAITQNNAPNWWVAKEIVEAAAVHDQSAGYEIWPFADPYNVKRLSIHGRPFEDVHKFFEYARLTHCTLVLYTHGCVVERSGSFDDLHCTVAEIENLCTEIATGVNGGWLEPTTFNRLRMLQEKGWTTLTST